MLGLLVQTDTFQLALRLKDLLVRTLLLTVAAHHHNDEGEKYAERDAEEHESLVVEVISCEGCCNFDPVSYIHHLKFPCHVAEL